MLAFLHVWASCVNAERHSPCTIITRVAGSKVKWHVNRSAGGGKSGRIMLLPVSCCCVGVFQKEEEEEERKAQSVSGLISI